MCAGYAPQDAESLEPGGVTCLADMLYEGKAGSDTRILLLLAYACVFVYFWPQCEQQVIFNGDNTSYAPVE